MRLFDKFYFESSEFDYEKLQAKFTYSFDEDVFFEEIVDFSCKGFELKKKLDEGVIQNLLFHTSLAFGISYYKLYPTKELVVKTGNLSQDQRSFWRKFYINGLGEYFFKNHISPKGLIEFIDIGKNQSNEISKNNFTGLFEINNNQAMLAIGGGKDSIVSAELLKKMGVEFYTATFGKDYVLHKIVGDKIGNSRLVIKRSIDPKLFQMNLQGYYNGHVPISGMIAFIITFGAYLYDYKYIIMSNEKSADEGNTQLDGMMINHQYSKSSEFEKNFSAYLYKYISKDVNYFSLLRAMYEIKIVKLFAELGKKYFDLFSSCNNNFKIIEKNKTTESRWCNKCPKCVFVYTIIRPFLTEIETDKIFGKDLFEDKNLEPLFKELLGISGIKPFECVGTNEEMTLAMYKSYNLYKKNGLSLPYNLLMFEKNILPNMKIKDFTLLEEKLFDIYDQINIPLEIKKPLSKII